MSNSETASPGPDLLAGYIHEEIMAKARGVTTRTLRNERQRGEGPPYVTINRGVYYSEPGWREWLQSIEKRPARARRRVA
ncbi:hypothetical protein [uncultured Rhodoblastus sp.]|uniref:hypothetical protein n=1 Tax=uncultured Rhodoblastus sp. TaxID=543037 RepID=UPI00260097EF|nr:hypothetical protein [uncultured Rhodoblastus sp.]